MKKPITGLTVLAGANILLGNSAAEWKPGEAGLPPNIMIIIADDCTYSDLPLYGGRNVKTPNIDRLASDGLTFNRAFVSMSMSVPCRASLYTGLYPFTNGVCWNHVPARNNTRSIVHFLGGLGYRTGLAGKVHANPYSVFPFEMVEGLERDCVAQTAGFNLDEMRKFITRDRSKPFCIIAALVVPHVPWTVGDPSRFNPDELILPSYLADTQETRTNFAKYLAEVEVMDQQTGELMNLLSETGNADNTVVIFTSEQGAQLPGCKWTNWNTGVHTGFIVSWPGKITGGKRTDAMIQYEDVLPTLVEAAGGKIIPGDFEGTSFLGVLKGEKKAHREFAYFMHNNTPEGPTYPIRSITDGTWHYIHNLKPGNLYIEKHLMARMPGNDYWASWVFQAQENEATYKLVMRYMNRPEEHLYRIDSDPYELENMADRKEMAEIKRKLSSELDEWMKSQGDPGAEIDTRDFWDNARKGNHFSKTTSLRNK